MCIGKFIKRHKHLVLKYWTIDEIEINNEIESFFRYVEGKEEENKPRVKHRVRVHGFRKRMASADGQNVLKRRRLKGRYRLAVKRNNHTKNTRW